MASHRRKPPLIGRITGAVLLALVLTVPLSAAAPEGLVRSTAAVAASGPTLPADRTGGGPWPPTVEPVALPESGGFLGPFHGRYFTQNLTSSTGVASDSVALAIDTTDQRAFVANDHAGSVTAFDLRTGSLLGEISIGPGVTRGGCLCGLAFDSRNDTLFLSVIWPAHRGWIEAISAPSLEPVANISVTGFPAAPFEPYLSTYDPVSDQVFVQNQTGGDSVAVNASSYSVRGTLPCGLAGCASLGLTLVASHDSLVVPTSTSTLVTYNTSTDLENPPISAPLGRSIGPVAFDTATHTLVAENLSSAPTVFLNFSLSTGVYTGEFSGAPPSASDLAYDGTTNTLLAVDSEYHQRLSEFNGSTGSREATYNASQGPGSFARLALDPGLGEVVTVGSLNNTTDAFSLPSLSLVRAYASFPYAQTDAAVDPLVGLYYVAGLYPGEIQAFDESSGSPRWTAYPPTPLYTTLDVVADPSYDTVYEASIALPAVHLYNATTGASAGAIPLAHVPTSLGIDTVHQLLYVAEAGAVQVFSASSHVLLGRAVTPGVTACGVVVDPALSAAFLPNCNTPNGNVTTVFGTNFTKGTVYGVGSDPQDGVVLPSGNLLFANSGGTNLSEIDPTSGTTAGSTDVSPFVPSELLADPADGLLLVTSLYNTSVEILDSSSLVALGALPTAQGVYRATLDNVTGTLVAPLVFGGRVEVFGGVSHPEAPTAVALTSGNSTLELRWTASGNGGAPITEFNVSTATGPSGPWGLALSTNQTFANLTGLNDGVVYYVAVTAENFAGTGPPSSTVSGIPAGIPFPPIGVTVGGATNATLNVSWRTPVSDDGSPVANFTVEYEASGGVGWSQVSVGTALSTELPGLVASTNYTVRVIAWNSVGASHPSGTVGGATSPNPVSHGPGPKSGPIGSLAVDVWLGILVGVIVVAIAATLLMLRRRRPPSATPVSTVPPAPPASWTPPPSWSEDEPLLPPPSTAPTGSG